MGGGRYVATGRLRRPSASEAATTRMGCKGSRVQISALRPAKNNGPIELCTPFVATFEFEAGYAVERRNELGHQIVRVDRVGTVDLDLVVALGLDQHRQSGKRQRGEAVAQQDGRSLRHS